MPIQLIPHLVGVVVEISLKICYYDAIITQCWVNRSESDVDGELTPRDECIRRLPGRAYQPMRSKLSRREVSKRTSLHNHIQQTIT